MESSSSQLDDHTVQVCHQIGKCHRFPIRESIEIQCHIEIHQKLYKEFDSDLLDYEPYSYLEDFKDLTDHLGNEAELPEIRAQKFHRISDNHIQIHYEVSEKTVGENFPDILNNIEKKDKQFIYSDSPLNEGRTAITDFHPISQKTSRTVVGNPKVVDNAKSGTVNVEVHVEVISNINEGGLHNEL